MGNGGEGTLGALLTTTDTERRETEAHNVLGRPTMAFLNWQAQNRTAYIEPAEARGL